MEQGQPDQLRKYLEHKRQTIKDDHMYHKDDRGYRFVSEADSRALWTDKQELRLVFPSWKDEKFKIFEEHHAVAFTILVHIEWPIEDDVEAFDRLFEDLFFKGWRDSDLPIHKEDDVVKLRKILGRSTDHFLDEQYTFKPVTIEKLKQGDIVWVDHNRPLPFVEPPIFEGGGAFGQVWKVEIARYCYSDSPGMRNSDNGKIIAFKKFVRQESYKLEVKNFSILRESLAKHDCIATHLGALTHGNDFYIFIDHTPLGDLQVLLDGGFKEPDVYADGNQWEKKYDFDEAFAHPLRSHFLKQVQDIASGLDHLHVRLPDFTDEKVFCAHMDLKPNNILVYPVLDSDGPNAGRWVLTDFGISSFKKHGEAHRELRTMADILAFETTGNERTERLHVGTHCAPELHEDVANGKKHGVNCDVWSYGCIMNEIFAFILPGFDDDGTKAKESLSDFKDQKLAASSRDDYWFDHSRNSGEKQPPKVKQTVIDWLEGAYNKASKDDDGKDPSWIKLMSSLILDTLIIDPAGRPTAKQIRDRLDDEIRPELEEFEGSRRSPSPKGSSTKDEADALEDDDTSEDDRSDTSSTLSEISEPAIEKPRNSELSDSLRQKLLGTYLP